MSPMAYGGQVQQIKPAVESLRKIFESDNIAEHLPEDQLKKIGRRVVDEYKIDNESELVVNWREESRQVLDIAAQVHKEKTFPWEGAANVRLPLIADAAIKFQSRAYAEIVKDNRVVKAKIIGDDEQDETGQPTLQGRMKAERGERVSEHMSYQLLEQMPEWENDTDSLLLLVAIVGHVFRKTYYDKSRGRLRSYLTLPDKIVVNKDASCLEDAARVTEEILTNGSFIKGMQNQGAFLDIELPADPAEEAPDEDRPYKLLEQHRWLDLDDDGIEEPYIVIVHEHTQLVLSITPRYDAKDIVTNSAGNKITAILPKLSISDYKFLPSLNGGYYGTGLGQLLNPLNHTANTIFNQLLDAGTLSNLQSGFLSKSVKIQSGNTRFKPGEWKKTDTSSQDLHQGVVPLPTKEPSATLFNLLGMVVDLTKDIASVKDILAGESPGANIPATTVAMLVEQGLKTYSAIYKRIYRSLKAEFKILYRLNYDYLDEEEYFKVLDNTRAAYREDYNYDDCDVVPVADPSLSSDVQRLAMGQALLETIELPGVNPRPIIKQYLEALKAKNIEEILPEEDPNAIPPEVMMAQKELELKEREVMAKEQEVLLKGQELEIKATEAGTKSRDVDNKREKYLAEALKAIASAESMEQGTQLNVYKTLLDNFMKEADLDERRENNARSVQAMGKQPDNSGGKKQTAK